MKKIILLAFYVLLSTGTPLVSRADQNDSSSLGSIVNQNRGNTFRDQSLVTRYCFESNKLIYFASVYIEYSKSSSNDGAAKNAEASFDEAAITLKLTKNQKDKIVHMLMNDSEQREEIMNVDSGYYENCVMNPEEYIINYQYLVNHQN